MSDSKGTGEKGFAGAVIAGAAAIMIVALVIRRIPYTIRSSTATLQQIPMSIEEAITRMEALGHPFFMYLDEEDDRISTVYVRNDGGYGVIQAENPIK